MFRVLVTINNNYYHYEIFLYQSLLILLKLLRFTFTAVNITLYNYLVDQFYPQFKVFLYFQLITIRPANSHDSATGLKILLSFLMLTTTLPMGNASTF